MGGRPATMTGRRWRSSGIDCSKTRGPSGGMVGMLCCVRSGNGVGRLSGREATSGRRMPMVHLNSDIRLFLHAGVRDTVRSLYGHSWGTALRILGCDGSSLIRRAITVDPSRCWSVRDSHATAHVKAPASSGIPSVVHPLSYGRYQPDRVRTGRAGLQRCQRSERQCQSTP